MRCQQLQLQEIFNRAILLHRAKSQPAAYVVGVSSDELSTQRQRPQTQISRRRRLLNIDNFTSAGTLVESLHREAMGRYKNRCPFTNAIRDALLTGRRRRLTVKRPRTKDPLLCYLNDHLAFTQLSKPIKLHGHGACHLPTTRVGLRGAIGAASLYIFYTT